MKQICLYFVLLCLCPIAFAQEEIPSRAKRLKAFDAAGLTSFASTMDELDQDIFYMRAKRSTLAELQKKYPTLSAVSLAAFVKEAK